MVPKQRVRFCRTVEERSRGDEAIPKGVVERLEVIMPG